VKGKPYNYTVTCISHHGELYCIKKSEFIKKMKSSEDSWNLLMEQINDKNKFAERRISVIDKAKAEALEQN
jgi:nitrate/TMAO reductase-like tetraheme cytochrome c subunit